MDDFEDQVLIHQTISRMLKPFKGARYSSTVSNPIQGIVPRGRGSPRASFCVSAMEAPHGILGPWFCIAIRCHDNDFGVPSRPTPSSLTNIPPLSLTRGSIHRLR